MHGKKCLRTQQQCSHVTRMWTCSSLVRCRCYLWKGMLFSIGTWIGQYCQILSQCNHCVGNTQHRYLGQVVAKVEWWTINVPMGQTMFRISISVERSVDGYT